MPKTSHKSLEPGDCLGINNYIIYRLMGSVAEDGFPYIEYVEILLTRKDKFSYCRRKHQSTRMDSLTEMFPFIMNIPVTLGREEFKIAYK